jgi:hypothetical protein
MKDCNRKTSPLEGARVSDSSDISYSRDKVESRREAAPTGIALGRGNSAWKPGFSR